MVARLFCDLLRRSSHYDHQTKYRESDHSGEIKIAKSSELLLAIFAPYILALKDEALRRL